MQLHEAQIILLEALEKIAKFKEMNGQGKFYPTLESNIAKEALAKVGFQYKEEMRTVT